MRAKKLLALFLSIIMLLGTMPTMAVHVHAEEHTWNSDATMTLKCEDVVVEPKEVIETADTKMKVYQINSVSDYTLTTSDDNDYAVMFEVNWSVISEDEYGHKDYDYEMTVTLDNVTIRTYNPRVDQNEKIHAAMTFSDEKCEERYETLNIELVGNNTVELLGVKDDSENDRWSAISFIGPNTVVKGDGTLNATCRYSNAVGAVSALYTENSLGLYDTVTLNATSDVKAKEAGTLIGDGLYFDDYEFIMEEGTTANVKASGSGIMHGTNHVRATWLDDMYVDGDLDVRSADYGISWQSGGIRMGDGASLSVKGLTEATAPKVGILVRRDVVVGAGCSFNVDALGAAFSCRASTTANPSAPLTIGEGSVAVLNGSVSNSSFVVDCGTKLSGKNNVVSGTGEEWYGETWRASELVLESGAKLTINGGYRALQALLVDLYENSELKITTSDVVDSDDIYEYGPVYLSSSTSNIYSGAVFTVETPAEEAIYGYSKLSIKSDNVYIKAKETALSPSIERGSGIYTFESDDGESWTPFANNSAKPYFTTREPATHICAASRPANTYSDKVWTPIEGEYKHTAKCIYCASDIVADCQWDRGAWSYSDGVYSLKFECEVCERERYSEVEYHSHVFDTWTPLMGDYYPMHESTCTVEGCGASTEGYCSEHYTDEYHVSLSTLRRDCTKCGQYTTRDIDTSTIKIEHIEAKPATCGEAGNTEFWICGHCNKYFSDESCQHELTPAQVYISPKEHKYVNNVCSNCEREIKSARFEQSMDDTFSSEDRYLYVLIGMGSDGKLYAMGEATSDGRRYGVEIPDAQIDANGIITLNSNQAEFMDFEYYFENGSGATTTSTFMVDGNYMTARYGKIYTFPQDRLDDKNNPRPFSFRLKSYSGESSLGYVDCDLYDPSDYSHNHEYITFNPETHYFEACEDKQYTVYLYRQVCDHEDIDLTHTIPVAPTCTEQGSGGDYWFCSKCETYFTDKSCTAELEIPEYVSVNEYYLLPALEHSFASNGVCENCGMQRNVYKPVTSLEQFDQLSNNAYYIIVFKDGGKTYAAYIPNLNILRKTVTADSDGDGLIDLLETDANANGIPDIIEEYIDTQYGGADTNEDGTTTADEYKQVIGSLDDDEDVDVEDYKQFFSWHIEYELEEAFREEYEINHSNVVEVSVAPDGSITIVDEGAMEFQMMPSGIWGDQDYDDSELEYENIKETDRLRAFWIPNYWFANYGTMGQYSEDHFLTQNRCFGDHDMPGVVDNKNWRISFNEDGTALLVSTWTTFEDSAALQLVKYTDEDGNERITMVGCYGELWDDSDILSGCTVISGAYLYASEPVYAEIPHECIWSDWDSDDVTDTHTRKCTVEGCDKKQTEAHNWDDGVQTKAPNCTENGTTTYTCPDCKANKTEPIPALDHDFDDWTYDSVDSHIRHCKRENCNAEDFGGHEWGEWKPVDENTHKMTCSICKGERTGEHDWDEGKVTKEATCKEKGVKTYTCQTCMHTRTEDVPTIDHEFGDWKPNNDTKTHSRFCSCNESESADHKFDDGVVTEKPTHTSKGIKTYTCEDCGYSYAEDIPALTDHDWGEWVINKLDEANTHIRYCICNESQTAPHNFDEGKVTEEATHITKGVKTFTCTDGCGYSYTEEIPTTPDHEWTNWTPCDNGTHTRACRCNATETKDCEWGDGVVTAPTCEKEGSTVYTCTVCGNTKTETKSALNHDWSDWRDTGNNAVADIHERTCKREGCDAKQIGNHEWSTWSSIGSEEHKKTCAVCSAYRTSTHNWDNGVETIPATVTQSGVITYTCSDCSAAKSEVVPKIVCDHTWGKWSPDDALTHTHICINENGCTAYQKQPHEWNEGVVSTEPTEKAEGVKTYTCLVCSFEKTESIPMLQHTHQFGEWTSDGANTHTHRCINGNTCTATETAEHTCDAWGNNSDGTHSGKCSVCGAGIIEEHSWGTWEVQDSGSLKRTCTLECGAVEEMPVLKPIEDAVVNTTKTDSNDAKAELIVDNAMTLFNDVLTDEEQKAVSEGNTTVSVYLEVSDIPVNQLSSSDKAAAEEVIGKNDNELNEKTEIGMYLDINLFKEVTTTDENTSKTESTESKVTETSGKVTVSIQIPDDLINTNSSVERTYRIIRVHEDVNGNLITDVIEGVFDPETKTFTFESDKFSTYALAYNDDVITYTVTYTDGVDASEIFADQQYTVNKGDATPAFVGAPTRSGYTFEGWTPAMTDTVMTNVVYKATWAAVITPPVHTHRFGTAWKTDGTNHWHECSCGAKKDSAAHSGGTATCEAKAKCSVCNAEYGTLAEHKYSEATCTKKATCSVCNAEKGELASHIGGTATCEAKAKCSVCNAEYGTLAEHKYSEATCTKKATCSVCNAEKGELLSHIGGTATCEAKAKCSVCNNEYGALAEHKYSEATCTKKATCSVCGDEKGELVSHTGGTATCEAKAKCSVCNAEYGALAEHKYSEATCTKKATCSVCGDEKGEFAEHKDADGNNECDACDAELSQEQSSSHIVWILISAISVALIAGAVVAVIFIKKKKGIA